MSWMIDNLGTIVVGLLLAAVVTAISIRLIKNKKRAPVPRGAFLFAPL